VIYTARKGNFYGGVLLLALCFSGVSAHSSERFCCLLSPNVYWCMKSSAYMMLFSGTAWVGSSAQVWWIRNLKYASTTEANRMSHKEYKKMTKRESASWEACRETAKATFIGSTLCLLGSALLMHKE
jgi:hypothetical protein